MCTRVILFNHRTKPSALFSKQSAVIIRRLGFIPHAAYAQAFPVKPWSSCPYFQNNQRKRLFFNNRLCLRGTSLGHFSELLFVDIMNYVLVGQKSFWFFPPISDISSFFFFENLFLKLYLDLHVGFENVLIMNHVMLCMLSTGVDYSWCLYRL